MKKLLTILLITGSSLMILDGFNFGHNLTLFLLAGVVPGSKVVISAIDMMAAFATAFTVVLLRVIFWPSIKNLLFGSKKSKSTKPAISQT